MSTTGKPIVVTVNDDSLADIHAVAKQLVDKGMVVERVLPLTGVITGTCSAAHRSVLGTVSGVLSVEDEAGVQIPPSDGSVQ